MMKMSSNAGDSDFPVDLDLEMVLGDMPQKVRIPLNADEMYNLHIVCLQISYITVSYCA